MTRRYGLLVGGLVYAANILTGHTPGPTAFLWQTHARGLAGHLMFGVAADSALRVLDGAA